MYENLFVLAALVFVYSAVSKRVEGLWLSGPIVFVGFGLVVGPVGLGALSIEVDGEVLKLLAELTLAVVLFTDAAGANLRVLAKSRQIPIRLLVVGLPLTIVLGVALGDLLLPGLTFLEIALLATMLAPTDAALGSAVVTNPRVPAPLREGLNVESGLNDGICVPILLVLVALAASPAQGAANELALRLVLEEIGIGLAAGLAVTALGGQAIRLSADRDWITDAWHQMIVTAMAVSCFALSQWLGGSGFIASFSGGLLFGALTKKHKHALLETAEGLGNTLALVTWVLFGAGMVAPALAALDWQVALYAALSLTAVRMVPVALSLAGSGVPLAERLFTGWFGPRGLASIVFAVIVAGESLPAGETLTLVATTTVILSIVAHGVSANPLIAVLTARAPHKTDQ